MPFQLQKTFNYGTNCAAVARTAIQGRNIIQALKRTDAQEEDAFEVLMQLMSKLLRCVEIHEQIAKAVSDAHVTVVDGSLMAQQQANVLRPPSIADLENKAESFVQAAKLAISHATRLTKPFYGQDFGHKLNRMAKWAERTHGEKHRLVQFAQRWQPWVIDVLAMRDAVDHPRSAHRGQLHIRNFYFDVSLGGLVLRDPQWWLEGEQAQPMAETMAAIIETTIQMQEDLLVTIFEEFKGAFPMAIEEIAFDQRDASCPVRLRVNVTLPTR